MKAVAEDFVPTLLRESSVYLLKSRAKQVSIDHPIPLLPMEHMSVMGWPLDVSGTGTDEGCAIGRVLRRLPPAVVKGLAGNGMHLSVLGAVIYYCMVCSARAK